ncbi:MAG TPA: hypothetical protein EYN54_11155, partial [Methylococcaceae bacterium]|nr:hypothetical protein [Methylococcaceae bacterium]
AKKIAETITFVQLQEMFNNAKENITDWTVTSAVNKQMSKGTAWNILFVSLKPETMTHPMAIKNMIWEFGDHLPEQLKIKKQTKVSRHVDVTHQEPNF